MRPVLLDLFCGAGGASAGYWAAGFHVIGIDDKPQPSYPFHFYQMDWEAGLERFAPITDAVHASPPCQTHSLLKHLANVRNTARPELDLIAPVRAALIASGKPYVMENVPQAGLSGVRLCGPAFSLKLYRHRDFETSFPVSQPTHAPHKELCMRAGYLPTPERPFMSIHGRNGHNSKAWVAKAAEYMGMPWASADLNGVCEAIPPAYTQFLAEYLLNEITSTQRMAA